MPNIGDTITCTETGKTFVVAKDGCSYNYARGVNGELFSDEGVDIRERRALLDRTKPFTCYLHARGTVTGWKGNVLGRVVSAVNVRAFGKLLVHVRVVDVHGGRWYGKGQGAGIYITLYPNKEKTHD